MSCNARRNFRSFSAATRAAPKASEWDALLTLPSEIQRWQAELDDTFAGYCAANGAYPREEYLSDMLNIETAATLDLGEGICREAGLLPR